MTASLTGVTNSTASVGHLQMVKEMTKTRSVIAALSAEGLGMNFTSLARFTIFEIALPRPIQEERQGSSRDTQALPPTEIYESFPYSYKKP